jgi:hypothetical protein
MVAAAGHALPRDAKAVEQAPLTQVVELHPFPGSAQSLSMAHGGPPTLASGVAAADPLQPYNAAASTNAARLRVAVATDYRLRR